MPYKYIYDRTQESTYILTINRPESDNKLNIPCMNEITEALKAAEADDRCRVIIVTSTGEYFCGGGELGDYRVQSPIDIMKFGKSFIELHTAIVNLPKPVIAAVHGHVRGGGFSLVEACDLCIASQGATFGVPEIHSGLAPMMALAGVSRVLSRKGSMELAYSGNPITASRALEIGLVNKVCKNEDVLSEAIKTAKKISMHNPAAISLCKKLYGEADSLGYREKLEYGLHLLVSLLKSEDAGEAITAREEKRSPVWRNR